MAEATEGQLVLVTGASGYIANHIIKQLQEEGYRVRGTIRSLQDEDKVKRLNELCPDAAHKLELVEADLTKPDSWEPAVKDVDYVIHVASPFPHQQPKDENEPIKTAVDGTQAILKACMAAKSIKRVVMTSSSVAVGYGAGHDPNKVFNEEDWTDPEKLDAYGKSKTMAEKAAWDYVKELPDEDKIELAVINPGYVMGPAVNGTQCSSMEVIKRLMERSMPFVPKLNFAIVDVRDVATAHIKAMTLPEASGKRHLLVNTNMWMRDIAQTLAKVFKQQGYNVPTTNCPNPMLYIAGLFDKGVKMIIPQCGKIYKFDNSRMKNVLGIEPRDAKDTLIDMAYSLVEAGYIKRSKKYKGPHAAAEEAQEEKKEADKKEGEESEEKAKENGDVKEEEEDDLKKEKDGETDDKAEIKKEEEEKKSEEKKEEKSEDKSEDKNDEKTEETPAEK